MFACFFVFLYHLISYISAFVFVFLLYFCKKRLSSSLLPFWLFPLAEVTPSVSHYVELPSQHFFVKHTDIITSSSLSSLGQSWAWPLFVMFLWTYGTNLNHQNTHFLAEFSLAELGFSPLLTENHFAKQKFCTIGGQLPPLTKKIFYVIFDP